MAQAFDNRSLRTKISVALLAAILSGLVVGGVGLYTVQRLNRDAEAAHEQTIVIETAVGAFSKNVEAFGGGVSAAQLYPALADAINKGLAANRQAIADALNRLRTALSANPSPLPYRPECGHW